MVKIKMKAFAVVQMGYSFRSRLQTAKNGKTTVIQMKDLLDNYTVECTSLTKIDMETIKKHHLVQKGDIIFRSRGLVATSAILPCNLKKTIVAAPLLKIRITKPDIILPEYLNWYINQRDAQVFLTSRAKGTAQKMISKQEIEELEVSLPPLEQQKNIVELASLSAREQIILNTLAEKRKQYISTILMQFAKGE